MILASLALPSSVTGILLRISGLLRYCNLLLVAVEFAEFHLKY